jgi:TonB family protein
MTMITLLAMLLAGFQQAAQPNRFSDGQVGKVCGIPTAYRVDDGCQVTLVVTEGTAPTEVMIPASVRRNLAQPPEQLVGGSICASGQMSVTSSGVVLRVASQNDFQVLKAPTTDSFGGDARLYCDEGLKPPQILQERKPDYAEAALRAGIQGGVDLEAIVDRTGHVSTVRVLKSLDPELDQKAVEALKDWVFSPGTVDRKAVPVRVYVEMTFATRRKTR